MYTTVQQQNNYTLDAITLHCKELKTFLIIYNTRNTMAERKYNNASKARVQKKTRTATESSTQHSKCLDYRTSAWTKSKLEQYGLGELRLCCTEFLVTHTCMHNY